MSDLLGRMIARARAPLSPIQPILAAIYEPVAGPEPEPVSPWPIHEPAREETSSREPRSSESPVDSEPSGIRAGESTPVDQTIERSDPGLRVPESRHAEQTIERRDPGLRIPESRPVDSRRNERLISTPEEGSGLDHEPWRDPSIEARAISRPQPATVRRQPTADGQEGSSQPSVAAGSTQAEHSQQAPRPLPVQATWERKPEAPINPGSLEINLPTARVETRGPAIRESGKREREDPVRDSPVEVNVAIGHIEVRSVPRVEAPRRPAAKPEVTLDEYLRRRDGESR